MGNVQELSDSSFEAEVLNFKKPVLVDFWSPDCPPCRRIAPLLEKFATENAEAVKVAKVNTDDNVKLATDYRIYAIPTLILFQQRQGSRAVCRF